jgi:hypothetical protein
LISIFFAIIFFIISDYLSSSWRIIRIKKMKHFMKMTFKKFKIRISILNHFVVQINASKSSHRELKERLLDSNHSSLFHLRSLRRRKMNQNFFSSRRNHSQVAKRKRIRTSSIQHLVFVRLTFVLKRKSNITRNRVVQQTTMIFVSYIFHRFLSQFTDLKWYSQDHSKDKTSSKVYRISHFASFFCSIDKKANVSELHRKFNTSINRDSLTDICISSSSRKNEDLIDCLFSWYKFMQHNMIETNFDRHSSRRSSRRSSYHHTKKHDLRHEVLQKTRHYESIDDELIN